MRIALILLAAALGAARPAGAGNHDTVVPPIGTGLFEVACSNVAQDPAAIAALGSTPQEIWEGRPRDGQGRYITDILASPQSVVQFEAPVPDVREMYRRYAGSSVGHVAIVCHPTPARNADPDYVLPGTGDIVPRMLPAGAAPKFLTLGEYFLAGGWAGEYPDIARFPLVVFSHGLGGSPISPGYLDAIVSLASNGFVVAAVFHGDSRFSRIRIEDLGDFVYALTEFDEFVEMELLRPVALKAMTDALLAHPHFSAVIDPEAIGGFGASLGGQALANLLGARLTTSLGLACRETVRDARVKAAVGLVPYAGQTFLPSFCDDQNGAADVTRPYLAMSGTADTTAPIGMMEQALNRFRGSRYLVELEGVKHEFLPEHVGDVMTWAVTFLRAYLRADARLWEVAGPGAGTWPMAKLIRMKGVEGGPADSLRVDVHVAAADPGADPVAIELHNESLDHYFTTADAAEAAAAGPGWNPTGHGFRVSHQPAATRFAITQSVPVCRFHGLPVGVSNARFLTADKAECSALRSAGDWQYEGTAFWVIPHDAGRNCPPGMRAVMRAYNNGHPGSDSNHRYTTSNSTMREMALGGWVAEGTVMCSAGY